MKTSLDLPDGLYRRIKAKCAMEGRAVREVASALFSAWLDDEMPAEKLEFEHEPVEKAEPDQAQIWLNRWRELGISVDQTSSGQDGLTGQLKRDRR